MESPAADTKVVGITVFFSNQSGLLFFFFDTKVVTTLLNDTKVLPTL
jgi:hypothetical protein